MTKSTCEHFCAGTHLMVCGMAGCSSGGGAGPLALLQPKGGLVVSGFLCYYVCQMSKQSKIAEDDTILICDGDRSIWGVGNGDQFSFFDKKFSPKYLFPMISPPIPCHPVPLSNRLVYHGAPPPFGTPSLACFVAP